MARAAHGMRRIRGNDLTDHEPVEQHADASEILLDRRRRRGAAQLLDIGGDMHRLHLPERGYSLLFAPVQKMSRSAPIGGVACSCFGY